MIRFADIYPEWGIVSALSRQLSWSHFVCIIPFDDPLRRDFCAEMCHGRDYYLDLLFYHQGLRRLVAIDLKLAEFQAADKGQMELYLRWLDRHERQTGEDLP